MVGATNEVTFKRIIKLLALTHALPEHLLWTEFEKVQSLDKIIELIREGKING